MLALKYLLIAGGLGMILVAVSILLYDLYREVLYRRALAAPAGEAVVPATSENALAYFAGTGAAGLGTDFAGVQHRGGAERHGGRAREPDQRNCAGHAVSGRAFRDAAGGRCRAV